MKVELLYFEGCPNWTVADDRLREALIRSGRADIQVSRRKVETEVDAEQVGFTGSPTVRINGTDPFATGDDQVGLACRVYRTPAGLAGSPTVEQFIEALT